jgi:hypothetical protein
MATINFPDDVNGVTGAGIAAGVDDFTDPAYSIAIYTRALAGAPVAPTLAQIRVSTLIPEWAALADPDARAVFFNDPAAIAGVLGAQRDAVVALITNWPLDEGAARPLIGLQGAASVAIVQAYDAWIAIEPMDRDFVEIDYDATFIAAEPPGTTTIAKQLWQSLINFAVRKGWVVRRTIAGNGMIRFLGPEAPVVVNRSIQDINTLGFHDSQKCSNILVAVKVTFWLINHHVGQTEGVIDGFIGKVAKLQNLTSEASSAQTREVRKVIWAVGKMLSSRGVLHAVGCTSIVYHDGPNTTNPKDNDFALADVLAITPSDDVTMRLDGVPSGVAATSVFLTIAKRAATSIYGVCVPPVTSLGWDADTRSYTGQVQDHMDAIAQNPARHHMGSHFLTGQPRIVLNSWNEEEITNLSAFIHAISPGSTLSKASVVLPLTEIQGNVTYTTILGVRSSMAQMAGSRLSLLLIGRLTGGGYEGGLARQFAKLSAVDVTETKEQVRLIEMGEVSDNEEAPAGEKTAAKRSRLARNAEKAARKAARAAAGMTK